MEKATFAMGCFWGPDDFFSQLKGVTETVVGYSGGEKENPSYYDLGNHTETIQITFNPKEISYKQLLSHFWQQHDATKVRDIQYKSIIFYHNQGQKKLAEESLKEQEGDIQTEIRKATTFNKAEEYHQKYFQKRREGPLGKLKKLFS